MISNLRHLFFDSIVPLVFAAKLICLNTPNSIEY